MEDRICPNCGEPNPERARLCGVCRTLLVADLIDERGKLVTVVTSDIKGSTALGEMLDPESLREVLNRYFSVMRVVFESHGGTIEKIIGDAIVAVFGLPFRHDDDPVRAVEAAAESQRALATLNDELEKLWGVRLVNRTGIATGVVYFGRDAEGQHVLIGEPMDESTAMEQNAPPLEVLMAESVHREVATVVESVAMGPKSPKGSDSQIESFQLISVRARMEGDDSGPPEPSAGMRACHVCGEEVPEQHGYCIMCGAAATRTEARDSRKTVTIVFANPKPTTDSGEPLDPNAFTDVMTRYFEEMKTALERHGGTVEKFIGDAVMAVFGLPVRHEDDALRAIRAAADMQAALPALNEAFAAAHGVRLLNHIGVNTGEVIATGDASSGQRLVTGDAVNTAARLEQAAGPAEIILAELTHRLTRDHIEVEPIPPLMLKGKAEPVSAYRFLRVRDRPVDTTASATPFVGREAEMARLSEALREAGMHQGARLVAVIGDAGVGNSRLIREFATTAGAQSQVLRGRCLPYGDGITFWPFAEVIREAAAIEADDGPDLAIEKIRGLLAAPVPDADRNAVSDRVASMMGLSAAQFPLTELVWGIRRLLEAIAATQPLVMILDDIHSAEQTFLDVLDELVQTVEGGAILILCSARHELRERYADWARAHMGESISLVPLSGAETGDLVGELLGDLDASVLTRISNASEGNPLYAEQIVSMLQETGAIRREGERWVATRASGELAIPPTVQALVAARLDALGVDERAVIEPASVIGLSFADEALAELVAAEVTGSLENELGSLAAKEFIRPVDVDEGVYRFGHQVIKDTAYGSLLKRIRVALHERFVVWAERVNKERGRETEFEEILGYHLEQAYRYRVELGVIDDEALLVGERAATKLASAGRRAFTRGDLPAAVSVLKRAVAVLPEDAVFRVELLADLGEAHTTSGAFPDALKVLAEAAEIAERLDDPRLRARVQVVRLYPHLSSGEMTARQGIARAKEIVATLEPFGDDAGLARAWRLVMAHEFTLGRLNEAAEAADRIVEHASRVGDARLAARIAPAVAYVLVHGPTPAVVGIGRFDELLEGVKGDRKTEAIVMNALAQLRAMNGEFDEARTLYRQAQATLAEVGSGIESSSTSIESSRVELLAGDIDAAERELRRDDAALAAIDESYFRSTVAAILANVLWRQGALEEADAYAVLAKQLADEDDVWSQAAWRTAQAKILADHDRGDDAIALAQAAVDLVTPTEDVELRAETLADLGFVLERAGRHEASGPPLREALRLYEQKGDRPSAGLIKRRLAELASA